MKRKIYASISIFFLISLICITFISGPSESTNIRQDEINHPNIATILEGAENIVITDMFREATINGYGLVIFEDSISIKNFNNNPINSILVGIPVANSEDLIYFEATGASENTLFTERLNMIMKDYEMIAIYFDSPLLPHQTKSISFIHQYKNLLAYTQLNSQFIEFSGLVYPVFPYRAEGQIYSRFYIPEGSDNIVSDWGLVFEEEKFIAYAFTAVEQQIGETTLEPFLENIDALRLISFSFSHEQVSKMEVKETNREIFISPWGIIRIDEELIIENLGLIATSSIILNVPQNAKEIYASDDIGEILGVRISPSGSSSSKQVTIDLSVNRVRMLPGSMYRFKIRYFLPFEDYSSINWFQESIEVNLYSTTYEYLGNQQSIKIIIDGCSSVDYITEDPEAIKRADGTTTLVYTSNTVSPEERRIIQFTFTIDYFDLLLRPILIILTISLIASVYVLTIKTRKKDYGVPILKREFIPLSEIREFCALYEEKNALILEIRQTEEDAKRKKIAKKNLKNILNKNTAKIDEIQEELIPFKKILLEPGRVFESIIKRLDLLEAERFSIKDSLNLLESRYKRGRLPSRAAYRKLSDNFKKKQKKIDRSIDKYLQQLRSYLI